MENPPEPIKGADLQDLKELMGVTRLDLMWAIGQKSLSSPLEGWKMTDERSDLPILQPSSSLLVRYLLQYDEDSALPKIPGFAQIYEKVDPLFEKSGLGRATLSKMGPLLGVHQGAPLEWDKGMTAPSLAVQRLILLIDNAIKKDGLKGFKRYLSIVEEEAVHRGIGTLLDLFKAGSWSPRNFAQQLKNPDFKFSPELITDADLSDIRELLELTWWDFIWVLGRPTLFYKWDNKSMMPHVQPSTCILARYLREYDEECFIPQMPEHNEIYKLLGNVHPFKKLSGRVVGPLFGVTGWSFNQWLKGAKEPSNKVRHLFRILKNLIEQKGQKGFDQYFKVVQEEIWARELGSYKEVVKSGWGVKDFKEKHYPSGS